MNVVSTELSLDILQESYDKSVRLNSDYRREIDRLHGSLQRQKVESADILTGNVYRKLMALEHERRKNFAGYYEQRNIRIYPVEAIHVGKDIGGTDFTETELRRLAKSLSFVPLNINHIHDSRLEHLPHRRALPYPSNQSLLMRYDSILEGITGFIQIEDALAIEWIRNSKITGLSIEYHSLGGRDGLGIVGTGLALVTSDVKAADSRARIYGGLVL